MPHARPPGPPYAPESLGPLILVIFVEESRFGSKLKKQSKYTPDS